MSVIRVEKEIGGRKLILETGDLAKQAHGSVTVTYGDSIVLATVLTAPPSRSMDFFPLYVDYREARYAGGRIPGNWFKREGRPTTKEVITMRMIDRPIRPMFPEDFTDEVQIQCMVLSFDEENDPDLLAIIGASAALSITPCPFEGPIGAAKIGYVDGKLVVNPTRQQLVESEMNMLACGPAEALNMIEFDGKEVSDNVVADGLEKAQEVSLEVIALIGELVAAYGEVDKTYEAKPVSEELKSQILAKYGDRMQETKLIKGKVERNDTMMAIREEALEEYCPEDVEEPEFSKDQVKGAFYKTEGKIQRKLIMGSKRPDGRGMKEVRPLDIRVGVLPRTHGSAIFARGETQGLVTTTLGTPRDRAVIDGLGDEFKESFMLHYNFPPFSVGQIKPLRGPSRRDIGHGMLAQKALQAVMPDPGDFGYTVRVVAEMLEANGSTSQAAICGATMSMLDAGVTLSAPVAGISVGMVSDGEDFVLLTDIMGEEDFHGDMDFKVAGTTNGITAIQLDMKARGITQDRIVATLAQAKEAREFILEQMGAVLAAPREEINKYAPGMVTIKINPAKIGKVIGPGGKVINRIQDETGATIDIDDDGTISIFAPRIESAEKARDEVSMITAEAEVGKTYKGKVVSVRDFGAFIEIFPGQDGLCHVSELSNEYIKDVNEAVNVGDEMEVKVLSIDDQGRVKLSRKALM